MTCVCELGDVEVKFEDLLRPLPQSLIPQQVHLFLPTLLLLHPYTLFTEALLYGIVLLS